MASELNIGKTLADGGTQLLPSLTFSADPNTGVYNADINELGFTTNGSEKMRINNAGDVGIGGSPVGKLSVKGVTATDEGSHITFENTQGAKVFAVGGGKDGVSNNGFCVVNVTDDTAPLTISDAGVVSIPGNLGVGGTPNYNFESFASNAYAYLAASAWSATNTHQPMVMLRKAASNTINAASGIATENGESLGAVMWEAPNTGNGWRETAGIAVIEDGANTSTRPPSKMEFSTSDGSTRSTRLSISSAGLATFSAGIAVNDTSGNYGGKIVSASGVAGTATLSAVNTATTGTRRLADFFAGTSSSRIGSIETDGSATSFNTSSDYRLKENVEPLTGALDRLDSIPVYNFNFKADPTKTVDGFLAHEVAEFVPEAISGTKDEMQTVVVTEAVEAVEAVAATLYVEGDELPEGKSIGDEKTPAVEAVEAVAEVTEEQPKYQGIDQSKLVPLMLAAIKELKAKVTALENA